VIQVIDRVDDPRIAAYSYVGDPAWLRERGLFVAEGRLVVDRLIEGARFEIVSLLLTPAAFDPLRDRLAAVSSDVLVAEQTILNGITGFNFHRGCLALARRNYESSANLACASLAVALEGVGNPDNVGGIFRSAAALGADAILLDPACGDPFYRKAIRTSMGAVLRVPFARLARWPEDVIELRGAGLTLVGLAPRGSITIDEFAAHQSESGRFLVLAGSEGHGLSNAALHACDALVRIPIAEEYDSLNVVVAVSIALHRLRRHRF
jgi:tRNA G18 (ribose-2'-O)-methylase SpoU